ncbi:MAG: hypothetical protein RB292_04090 [Patescibacteria group bacterium]|nr:hypothetical protein [Patescibacteria group bacterium]
MSEQETGFTPDSQGQAETERPIPDFSLAKDWQNLDELIDQAGSVQGSREVFPADWLKSVILDIRTEQAAINAIPSAGGLRRKVAELCQAEGIKLRAIGTDQQDGQNRYRELGRADQEH